ncbi:capsule biosynthesis GfcC family protein [Dyella silvatica]|uniref:capsule biosynthesis GfcC family protein n=1 Tax=Dyella silvatica TaxID=2992128 RepID=UPI002253488F|nr:capsule biosynthesis GfcC family protein [Dyella silvatica]
MSLPIQAQIRVTVSGEVAGPGVHELAGSPRLADAVKAAQVKPDVYAIGAVWSQRSLLLPQRRLQAGLLFELGMIRQQASTQGDDAMAGSSRSLHDWLQRMPVTGRRRVHTLDPAQLSVSDADNFPLDDGDQLSYVKRPGMVRVVGALAHACALPQVGLKAARDYLADCPPSKAADRDLLYVIQPDGQVSELGIALWNRSPPIVLAPGAIIYVPLDQRVIRWVTDGAFNRELAEFLATQAASDAEVPK